MCWPAVIVVALHIEALDPASRNRVRHLACQCLFAAEHTAGSKKVLMRPPSVENFWISVAIVDHRLLNALRDDTVDVIQVRLNRNAVAGLDKSQYIARPSWYSCTARQKGGFHERKEGFRFVGRRCPDGIRRCFRRSRGVREVAPRRICEGVQLGRSQPGPSPGNFWQPRRRQIIWLCPMAGWDLARCGQLSHLLKPARNRRDGSIHSAAIA